MIAAVLAAQTAPAGSGAGLDAGTEAELVAAADGAAGNGAVPVGGRSIVFALDEKKVCACVAWEGVPCDTPWACRCLLARTTASCHWQLTASASLIAFTCCCVALIAPPSGAGGARDGEEGQPGRRESVERSGALAAACSKVSPCPTGPHTRTLHAVAAFFSHPRSALYQQQYCVSCHGTVTAAYVPPLHASASHAGLGRA